MDMMLTKERLRKLVSELDTLRLSNAAPVENIFMAPADGEEKPKSFEAFENGGSWGGRDKHCWFRIKVSIAPQYAGKKVLLTITTGREGGWDATNPQFLVYVNDKVIQGLDVNHRELFLSDSARAGETFLVDLYAYSGMDSRKASFTCSIASLESEVEALYYDIKVPLDAANCLQEQDKRRIDILKCLENTVALIDFRKAHSYHDSFLHSVKEARNYIRKTFYEEYCGHEDFTVSGIGHTHIDVAWLWPLSQTREKAVRSFSTVLELMRHYPEYLFTSSQPQLYQFVKENMPEVYEEIKERVREGRWEPEGAMWLEADCNLTGGESLIRQIMFGKRFFKEEFGTESKVLWLPDVFGYSAALPQILNKCDVHYFITSKISWNEYNKAPYDTFMWEGIDGSSVMTHFITATDPGQDYEKEFMTTYNGNVRASSVLGTWGRYQQKDLNNRVLMSYGYGDGGGGPTREMLEYGRRLTHGIPGLPKFKFDHLSGFLKTLSENVEENIEKLPRWVGELYLEYHRGTYTTMARNKRYNRQAELKLMETEGLYASAGALLDEAYPSEALTEAWRTVLLNQFHDIIPGSSIKQVYEDSKAQYDGLFNQLDVLLEKARNLVAVNVPTSSESVVVFNPTGFTMGGLVETSLPDAFKSLKDEDGSRMVIERTFDGKALFFVTEVPSKGYKVLELSGEEAPSPAGMTIRKDYMENPYYVIKLDEKGLITSIYDKTQRREVVKKGEKANRLLAFEDLPHNYDAWDINIYYQKKQWEVTDIESIRVAEAGSLRSTLEIRRRFLDSTIVQHIQIYGDSPRIDFKTHVDWKERHVLLKAAFPVDIHSDKAVYDIQFGNVERPTHWNTSWDMARFEVCAHKWADLSENGYGVSLLNNCKYGYDIKDGVMRLTLLKSATWPNEDADREEHDFIYSLLPHANDFRDSTLPQAYALNMPFQACLTGKHDGTLPKKYSMASVSCDHVIIDTIKKSEKGDETIIRLFEAHNRRGQVSLKLAAPAKKAWECNMLEENIGDVALDGSEISFNMHPYEIKTIKIRF